MKRLKKREEREHHPWKGKLRRRRLLSNRGTSSAQTQQAQQDRDFTESSDREHTNIASQEVVNTVELLNKWGNKMIPNCSCEFDEICPIELLSPERRMLSSLLEQAVRDGMGEAQSAQFGNVMCVKLDALQWVLGIGSYKSIRTEDDPFSFEWVCSELNIGFIHQSLLIDAAKQALAEYMEKLELFKAARSQGIKLPVKVLFCKPLFRFRNRG